jgi:hypothetical protein
MKIVWQFQIVLEGFGLSRFKMLQFVKHILGRFSLSHIFYGGSVCQKCFGPFRRQTSFFYLNLKANNLQFIKNTWNFVGGLHFSVYGFIDG